MKLPYVICLLFTYFSLGESYTKYGRTCKDIGCLSSETCVMESDPCSYYHRQNECGSYPTCKKHNDAGPPSCKAYICPPTKVCRLDGSTPKCVDDHSKVGKVGYDTSQYKSSNDQPSASGGSNLYPALQNGETTERPNVGYKPGGQTYQGGQVGSGYPGRPQQPQNPPRNPYPQQGYNGYNNGYNNPYNNGYNGYNGYPQQNPYQGGGNQYQQPYYNNQRYPNNYQNGYNNPYGGYGQQNSGSSGGLVDKIGGALKNYGTKLLKDAITKQLTGGNNNPK